MKTTIVGKFLACTAVAVGLFVSSCEGDDPIIIDNGGDDEYVVLQGNLTSQEQLNLNADKKYLLRGQVFVRENQTLTIPAGTVIMGEKSTKGTLIIDRGGKIIANGTKEKPVIMTSNQKPG
ncbi:MAG TPA: hypothetical protein PKA53_14245, partial [Sphingobacterium sp.]|nr:hypothetical protein [Sphingobacterium sp.]